MDRSMISKEAKSDEAHGAQVAGFACLATGNPLHFERPVDGFLLLGPARFMDKIRSVLIEVLSTNRATAQVLDSKVAFELLDSVFEMSIRCLRVCSK
jgi:hypothetical protein